MIRLVPLSRECLAALHRGDLELAGKLESNPNIEGWLVNAVVRPDGVVVGHGGFHGRPDESGTVEIGYTTLGKHRVSSRSRAARLRPRRRSTRAE